MRCFPAELSSHLELIFKKKNQSGTSSPSEEELNHRRDRSDRAPSTSPCCRRRSCSGRVCQRTSVQHTLTGPRLSVKHTPGSWPCAHFNTQICIYQSGREHRGTDGSQSQVVSAGFEASVDQEKDLLAQRLFRETDGGSGVHSWIGCGL